MKPAHEEPVLDAVHELMHLARSRMRQLMVGASHTLGPMEGRALAFFVRQPGSTLSDLVAHAGRDKGQLARLVGSLRDLGLLESRPDEADRRVSRLYPTAAALDIHQRVGAIRRQVAQQAVAPLSAAERVQLADLLERMNRQLRP